MPEKSEAKPTMLYDGDCGFCQYWVSRWQKKIGDKVLFAPYQEAGADFPQVSEDDCRAAVQLIMPDGSVTSGAHAIFKALEIGERLRYLHWFYEHVPIFGRASELIYQWVAHHRMFFSKFFVGAVKKCG